MLPLKPFPLELVYRHDLEGVDLTAWEEEHNNTLPDLKPIYIDVNHYPLASEWSCFAEEEHIDKDHVPHIQLARYGHELFLESHVEAMENKSRLLTECWQKYLYWLRMSLMRVERLPAPGQILTTAEGFTIERDILDTWAWGREKSYEDVYQEVIDGNMFPEYWDRALYEVFTSWVQFKRAKAGYRYLIDKWMSWDSNLIHYRSSMTWQILSGTIGSGVVGGLIDHQLGIAWSTTRCYV
ncbi:hypothetical protein QC764_504105 [Podospora pseudoanserina]|uniref:Uncharacterized protein n=1 Tax=Podospora pseudoanserina TaxID=2609844 RepID=A0ABR0I4X6_9PEZI|nr:hypothetical protein QC764_504105 [Podospora pseudoanserina]